MSEDWMDSPHGWLMRHYMTNGTIVSLRWENQELLARERALRAERERVEREKEAEIYRLAWAHEEHQRRIRSARTVRRRGKFTSAQYKKRGERMLMLRMAGLTLRQVDPGRSRERVRQIVHKEQRENGRRIRRKKMTLERYLFRKHGHGGRQYRLGA